MRRERAGSVSVEQKVGGPTFLPGSSARRVSDLLPARSDVNIHGLRPIETFIKAAVFVYTQAL